jgi:hypothetical protein
MISLAAFTAAQLASALGCTPQAIRQRLEGIPGQKQVTLTGLALAWPFETLPVAMRADLKAIADARRYPDARALLSAPTPAWTPKVPFLQTALAAQAKAANPNPRLRTPRQKNYVGLRLRGFIFQRDPSKSSP